MTIGACLLVLVPEGRSAAGDGCDVAPPALEHLCLRVCVRLRGHAGARVCARVRFTRGIPTHIWVVAERIVYSESTQRVRLGPIRVL